jgi:serine/threonine protein kinase
LAVDEHIPSKPRCVIKQLYVQNPGNGISKKAAELFHQEAVRLDELGKHPQIPYLLGHFEQNQRLYLIQELITGPTLTQELQQKGAYNETQIWELLQDLLPVLQYIHTHQVIHRDIKPSNIIRRTSPPAAPSLTKGQKGGDLVLIDFGVAKLLTDTALLHTWHDCR